MHDKTSPGPAPPRVCATFVTTTSYGTWLPGDLRGYVQQQTILPASPDLLDHAESLLSQRPVFFTGDEMNSLERALLTAANEYSYGVTDLSIHSWHLHWIVEHGFDSVATMVARLKTRMRQALGRGRVWTHGYCHRCLFTMDEVEVARRYIARHAGCRIIDGNRVRGDEESPGGAGG